MSTNFHSNNTIYIWTYNQLVLARDFHCEQLDYYHTAGTFQFLGIKQNKYPIVFNLFY